MSCVKQRGNGEESKWVIRRDPGSRRHIYPPWQRKITISNKGPDQGVQGIRAATKRPMTRKTMGHKTRTQDVAKQTTWALTFFHPSPIVAVWKTKTAFPFDMIPGLPRESTQRPGPLERVLSAKKPV